MPFVYFHIFYLSLSLLTTSLTAGTQSGTEITERKLPVPVVYAMDLLLIVDPRATTEIKKPNYRLKRD